jgi:malonyl-CoA O-methyltransferase
MIDLIAHLKLPVILVARTKLGTINHTLLSLAALRARSLKVAGVVLVGAPSPGNREAIARHGAVRILHELPFLASITTQSVEIASESFPNFTDTIS